MRTSIVHGIVLLAAAAPASATLVERGYLPLADGTQLNYTLTLPDAVGRYPVVLKFDPYAAGVTSDPTWNDAGYAMLGVNIRGTGCSQGTLRVNRADQWGQDGAEVVAWAASQPWSSGAIGMIGYSFTGTSQIATAAFAGEHLKAIAPGNVFPDLYRDIVYPGGVFNKSIPAWIAGGRAIVGADATDETIAEPECLQNALGALAPDAAQTPDVVIHSYLDDYWSTAASAYYDRVHVPILGCVNWQDTTVYSRSAHEFRDAFDPRTTWMVAGNGAHGDCPISRARMVRFFDRYLKGLDNDWEATPHVLLIHEVTGASGVRETLADDAGSWQTSYAEWSDLAAALRPLSLHLHPGGVLGPAAPAAEARESYRYPLSSMNTPGDFAGMAHWGAPLLPGGELVYTTPAMAQDAEFMGSGSVDLWIASTGPDVDVEITLSEIRPDGQDQHVQNGWLRLSHRKLDLARSTPLLPWHTHLPADAADLPAGEPVQVRIELQPFNHVFRAGSALRLVIAAPGFWMPAVGPPATNTVVMGPQMASKMVLGWLPQGRAPTPLPACGSVLNQPCRAAAGTVPPGELVLANAAGATTAGSTMGRHGGSPGLQLLLLVALLGLMRMPRAGAQPSKWNVAISSSSARALRSRFTGASGSAYPNDMPQ